MKSFVVAGDNHLRLGMWQRKPDLRGDAYCSFNQLIDYCTEQKLPLCLAGDVFDSDQPQPEDISTFVRGMHRMRDNGLQVFYIQGQHEFKNLPWVEALHLNVSYVHEKVFTPVPGFTMYGLDRLSAENLKEALQHVPDTVQGLMLHQWERSSFPIPDAWNLDLAWLPPGIKLVALGDYHKPYDIVYPGGIGFYTGSQHLTELGEEVSKSFVRVDIDDKGQPTYQRIPLRTRRYFHVKIMTNDELDAFIGGITHLKPDPSLPEAIQKPILVVEYMTALQNAGPRIIAAAGSAAHLFTKPITHKEQRWMGASFQENNPETNAPENVLTLSMCLDKVADKGTDEYEFLHDLVTKPGTLDVLATWRRKYGVSDDVTT